VYVSEMIHTQTSHDQHPASLSISYWLTTTRTSIPVDIQLAGADSCQIAS
jgi:hypothetical protein